MPTIGFISLKRFFFLLHGKWNTFSFVRLLFYNILGQVDISSLLFFLDQKCVKHAVEDISILTYRMIKILLGDVQCLGEWWG